MYYYKVLASSFRFHSPEALIYSNEKRLEPGSVVIVPLRNTLVLGIVTEQTTKPVFQTKPINHKATEVPLPSESLELLNWLRIFYPAPLGTITSQFLPPALLRKTALKIHAATSSSPKKQLLPKLTKEQSSIIDTINGSQQKTFLLHGDTGSGKTRVYLELAKAQLSAGKSVLILTPEIGLTPQLVRSFEEAFGRIVVVMHSNLTDTTRRNAWLHILESRDPVVVIGPRSAVFAPFSNLGLIVIDEAHEAAYKQEQAPHYQTTRVASKLAEIYGSLLVFGTATPLITDYNIALAKNAPILRMQELAVRGTSGSSKIIVVPSIDKSRFTRHPFISDDLLSALESSLQKKEQSLVFLNRRGTARLVLCQNCGWQAMCPVCDLPLTYHGDTHIMRCHTCGYKEPAVSACPICNGTDVIFKSIGTKSIAVALQKSFPKARIKRFDTDNKKTERIEDHYHEVVNGKVDILIGTQILAKGLDLPKLGLVGVVAADTSLYFPDYTAQERTYQLLSQVIGRVGRGHVAGKAIIQTYSPESSAIKAALSKNWEEFYSSQIKERESFLFPPFCYLLKLTCSRKSQKSAIIASQSLLKQLQELRLKVKIIGPAPAFHEKIRGNYKWQLVIKAKNRSLLLKIIQALPAGWSYDIDPTNLL